MTLLLLTVSIAAAQTFTPLVDFNGANGSGPSYGSLVQGTDGNFYGTTSYGGANNDSRCGIGCGTIFKITPAGKLTTLYSFCAQANCSDGFWPYAGLVQGSDGYFYGTTISGGGDYSAACGQSGCGTVFRIIPAGVLTTLKKFHGTDGKWPTATLVQSFMVDGNYYGTTRSGGANGGGTFFKITRTGAVLKVHDFCVQTNCADGADPVAGLIQADDGYFYGVTRLGGSNQTACLGGCGTVFRIAMGGNFKTLYSFCAAANCTDGVNPIGALVQAIDGNLYGTAFGGGNNFAESGGGGTIFKMGATGKLTTLYRFCTPGTSDCNTGSGPTAGLIQGSDYTLYGTTVGGGPFDPTGTVYQIIPGGSLTPLYDFCPLSICTDANGAYPLGGLLQGTNGNFYGMTELGGGTFDAGTIFSLGNGLPPFLSFASHPGMNAQGTVGMTEGILGQGLTGTTEVSFNGTPASFKVKSDHYLTATVPAGATSGFVAVTTTAGTLQSVTLFLILPQISSFSPAQGPVGTKVVITGKSFSGATAATLACKWPMSFTVDSDTQITAIIPPNATTGGIGVRTAGGNVESAGTFTVTP